MADAGDDAPTREEPLRYQTPPLFPLQQSSTDSGLRGQARTRSALKETDQDSGELDFKLDCTVELEVPREQILITVPPS